MKIDFQSKKWDKEVQRLKKWNDSLKGNYYNNIRYSFNDVLKQKPYDYVYFYGCSVTDFEIVARSYYIDNKIDKVFENIYLSACAFFCFKDEIKKGSQTTFTAIEEILSEYEYSVCKLIAVNQLELFTSHCKNSIMANLFLGNEENAKKYIALIPDSNDEKESIYYNTPIFLKKIYCAIMDRDAEKFNKLIIQRIKKYRKNVIGYSTIIDYTSIALFKVAEKYGIRKEIDIVEIPQFFWDEITIDPKVKSVFPLETNA